MIFFFLYPMKLFLIRTELVYIEFTGAILESKTLVAERFSILV